MCTTSHSNAVGIKIFSTTRLQLFVSFENKQNDTLLTITHARSRAVVYVSLALIYCFYAVKISPLATCRFIGSQRYKFSQLQDGLNDKYKTPNLSKTETFLESEFKI